VTARGFSNKDRYAAAEEDFAAEAIGEISPKGIHAPVEVFRVSGGK
jgi:class 3 adenylate cyclase